MRDAREIVRRGADLADQVLAKRMNFDEALEAAQKRRKEAITREEKIERIKREAPEFLDLASTSLDDAIKKLEEKKAEAARFNLIRHKEPHFAARVNEAMISVDEALAIYRNREEARHAAREGATHRLEAIMTRICLRKMSPEEVASRLMANVDPGLWPQDSREILSADRLEVCAKMLLACAVILRGVSQ